ncbi:MAG TPA: hypothetical protein VEU09_01695 [Candidatus Binatia bacterium]|nr:hypothetical protein [Candidatus Binatia bacterium]
MRTALSLFAAAVLVGCAPSPAHAQRDSTVVDSMPHTMEPRGFPAPVTPEVRPEPSTTAPPVEENLPGPPGVPSRAPRVTSTFTRTGEETDRFELGGGVVHGFFDAVGSFGYRRWVGQKGAFEESVMGELTGAHKDQLTEGVFSAYLLFRPAKSYRESQRIRPLVEFGPGFHTVFQAASLEGLNRSRYKSQIYLKTHAYGGVEAILSRRLGFLVRGRVSFPSHRPFDYAQAAILLR